MSDLLESFWMTGIKVYLVYVAAPLFSFGFVVRVLVGLYRRPVAKNSL